MILKTIKENDSMLDLVKNVKTNIEFYIKHREELADLRYSNEELFNYTKQLNDIISMYDNNKIQRWFKDYNAYLFMSGKFPYILPYLSFCFSFKDFIDIQLMIGKVLHDGDKQYVFSEVENIDGFIITPIFIDIENKNNVKCESYKKDSWNKLKQKIF